MDPQNLHLQLSLRKVLKDPMGVLIEGTIDQTIPELKRILENHKGLLIGVGDVTADILVTNEFDPNIVITDGHTKREKLPTWTEYPHYIELRTHSPAATITKHAWKTIIAAIHEALIKSNKVHVKVEGEEDLLVLPLILELPIGSIVVYGQPNQGAVVHAINDEAKASALSLMERMEVID